MGAVDFCHVVLQGNASCHVILFLLCSISMGQYFVIHKKGEFKGGRTKVFNCSACFLPENLSFFSKIGNHWEAGYIVFCILSNISFSYFYTGRVYSFRI